MLIESCIVGCAKTKVILRIQPMSFVFCPRYNVTCAKCLRNIETSYATFVFIVSKNHPTEITLSKSYSCSNFYIITIFINIKDGDKFV